MPKLISISLIMFFASLNIDALVAQQKTDDVHRFIFTMTSMNTASVNEAVGIFKVLVDQIKKKNKRVEKTDVLICTNTKEVLDYAKKGFDIIIMSTSEYLLLKKQLPLQPAFVSSTEGSHGTQYLFVANTKDNIQEISQLAGSDLRILGRENIKTQELIIEQLLKNNKLPKKELFFRSIKIDPLINNVVLPVFFKQAKSALVNEHALNFISELNPQLKKDLKVFYRSPNYIATIICLNKNSTDFELKKLFGDVLTNLHMESFGKQLLDLFAVEKIIPFKEEYLSEYLKLYE